MLRGYGTATKASQLLMEGIVLSTNLRELQLIIGPIKAAVLLGMLSHLPRMLKLQKFSLDINGSWFGDRRVACSVLRHLTASSLSALTELHLGMGTCILDNECKALLSLIVPSGRFVWMCMYPSNKTSQPSATEVAEASHELCRSRFGES